MNRKNFLVFSLATILILSFAACETFDEISQQEPKDFVLKIMETTDVHGALLPYNFILDEEAPTSLAQVHSLVEMERQVPNQEVLLLDNGDILQGQPIVYYSNFEATDKPHVTSEVMNYMGYNVGVVGNHDIEAGHAVYDKLIEEYNFPWLAANVIDTSTGEPYFEPYASFAMNGAKIVVFGLCTPGVPTWLPENLWEGMEFRGMVETAQEWVPRIMATENPDLLIGLFHAGTDFTYSGYSAEDPLNPNGSLLVAEQVPGFDIIFTGHDHQSHEEWVENSMGDEVLILGGLNAAKTIPVATVVLDYQEENGTWSIDISSEIVDGTTLEVNDEYIENFTPIQQEVMEYVNKPIGYFTTTISTQESMFGDSAFVDLIHTVQLDISGADVSFAAPLSFDARINEGEVYVRDMFQLYKYENLLYTMELTGAQIDDFLEYSYGGWMDTMSGPQDHIIRFKKDENGELIWNERYGSYDTFTRYYNYDSAAGIEYVVDVSQPAGQRVNITSMANGEAFSPQSSYSVAINSYRASGGGGHLTNGCGMGKDEIAAATISSTDIDLRFYLMKWIEEQNTVTPTPLGNWYIEPLDWVEQGRLRDFEILYGAN